MKMKLIAFTVLVIFIFIFYLLKISSNDWSEGAKIDSTDEAADEALALKVFSSTQKTPGNRTVGVSASNTSIIAWEIPACKAKIRDLRQYHGFDTGRVYHHPPIAHYAQLTRDNKMVSLSFRDYISVLSVYRFLRPERIIFHTYTDMTGKYWDMTRGWKNVQVQVSKTSPFDDIGGRRPGYIQHEADYVKLRALHELGGIGLDFDVIVVNGTQLRHEQNISECVLSREGNFVNAGFLSCIKNSSYLAKWLDSYNKDYRPWKWLHNASYKPTGILKNPNTCYNVYLDDTICVNPGFGKNMQWLQRNGVKWKYKTAAHYFLRSVAVPNDDERLLQADHSLAELIRYIYIDDFHDAEVVTATKPTVAR